jgi:acetyl-CoA synthetase
MAVSDPNVPLFVEVFPAPQTSAATLPKTRSGKIMRRILRKVAAGEEDSIGDISTLADPSAVARLVESFKIAQNTK